jgi:hypothetical protein
MRADIGGRKKRRVIAFDLETEAFTDAFRNALSEAERLEHAPKMRLGCSYDSLTNAYSFYLPETVGDLIEQLRSADAIVSYNGKVFDLLVLCRHYGLSGACCAELNAKHHDLLAMVEGKFGRRVRLDDLARENLGERKRVHGRSMVDLDVEELKLACQSDVSQTHRLHTKWLDRSLRFPTVLSKRQELDDFDDFDLIHSHLPDDRKYILVTGEELEDMTEGQQADYLAGLWGIDEDGNFVQ